jgi:hypothetical protein
MTPGPCDPGYRLMTTTRQSAPSPAHRYLRPHDWSPGALSLSIAGPALTLPTRGRCAPTIPDGAWAVSGIPKLIPEEGQVPVLTSTHRLSTLQQRFCLRSPRSVTPYSDSFRNVHHRGFDHNSSRWFEIGTRLATEGPSCISRAMQIGVAPAMLVTRDPLRKIQDRIDRLAGAPKSDLRNVVQNVLRLVTAGFDAPLTAVAA